MRRNFSTGIEGVYPADMRDPIVGIIMGSHSDLETMKPAADTLEEFGVPYELEIVSAHRTPIRMVEYAQSARERGLEIIIAGAGGAAHLPGMTASLTTLPVIGVPVQSRAMNGLDSLYSIVQMPAGIPVATVGIGNGRNAGLLAVRMLSSTRPELAEKLAAFHADQEQMVMDRNKEVAKRG